MKFLDDRPLVRKVAIVTAVKLLAMAALWWVFFSEPLDRNLTPEQVRNAILHPPTRTLTTP